MTRGLWLGAGLLTASAAFLGARATAQPTGPVTFCEVYPDAPACGAGEVTCATCHVTPPALNVYGTDIAANLLIGAERPLHGDDYDAGLPDALAAVEALDSDGDGFTNLEEIRAGSIPADPASVPATCEDHDGNDGLEACGYDLGTAFKRVMTDFCGRSPTLAERETFADSKSPEADLHAQLDVCLDTEYWRGIDGRVWNLANKKIGPLKAVKAGLNSGPIPLADYDDDYAYFTWTQTDGRDARLVLTGQTFVSARRDAGVTLYEEWDRGADEDYALRGYDRYQAVDKQHRAGMLTHRWFLMVNTMFTAIPRTTAAQAYRAYLGHDIARLEGLHPVDGEPKDYDSKGVDAPACATCHSTLDPLAYPFSRYEGIGGGYADSYSYGENRLLGFVGTNGATVALTPEQGVLLGEPVDDLVSWARVAADSEDFRRAVVRDYWRMLLGEEPRPTSQVEFGALVDGFGTTNAYSVEAMLHDLVDTEAYGAP